MMECFCQPSPCRNPLCPLTFRMSTSVPVRPLGPVSPVLTGCVLNCWRLKRSRRPQKQEADICIFGLVCSGVCSWCIKIILTALISLVSAEAHSGKRWLFYTQVWAIGMPGIVLAFLTPDSDKRTCRKLPLLKPCLWDIGHPCDTAASTGYVVSETWNIVVTELREEEPRQSCGVTSGGKRVGDQPSTGRKNPWTHEVEAGRGSPETHCGCQQLHQQSYNVCNTHRALKCCQPAAQCVRTPCR